MTPSSPFDQTRPHAYQMTHTHTSHITHTHTHTHLWFFILEILLRAFSPNMSALTTASKALALDDVTGHKMPPSSVIVWRDERQARAANCESRERVVVSYCCTCVFKWGPGHRSPQVTGRLCDLFSVLHAKIWHINVANVLFQNEFSTFMLFPEREWR